jgi:hypothetical protein
MTITIRKIRKADVEYGDRAAQFKVSGRYGVFADSKLVGMVWSPGSRGYMERADWEVTTMKDDGSLGKHVKTFFNCRDGNSPFAKAKAFAIDYFGSEETR